MDLNDALATGVVYLSFTKKDGSIAHKRATRKIDLIFEDKLPKGTGGPNPEHTTKFFDLDIGEWRSCITDNVLSFDVNDPTDPTLIAEEYL